VYREEGLPLGPDWEDVQRFVASFVGDSAICGASGFFGHRFGVKRVFQTGVVDGEES
jgi:hypothetical protein